MFRTANPALNENIFTRATEESYATDTMTVGGTVNKTAFFLLLTVLAAAFTWRLWDPTAGTVSPMLMPLMIGGAIGGLVFALITIFVKKWAAITGSAYAICEGLLLGGLSSILNFAYPGIVIQAVGLTFGTLALILTIYKTGIIKVTDKFRMGVFAATGAIFLIYLATFIVHLFGGTIPYIHGNGWIGIGFSLLVIVIATLNLVLDFDFIERGSAMGAPKYMEWYGAFGLMVTLIWLYIEFLRLLAKLRSR